MENGLTLYAPFIREIKDPLEREFYIKMTKRYGGACLASELRLRFIHSTCAMRGKLRR